jgi:transposase
MSPKRRYYGFTTAQQRKLLFETWESTSSVMEACEKAHVSRGLFYYWKARYDKEGYAGLEKFESRAAHKLNKKDASIEQAVIRMKKEHEDWGKRRIAEELAKANNWEPLVSLNTVRRILESAGMWAEAGSKKKRKSIVV